MGERVGFAGEGDVEGAVAVEGGDFAKGGGHGWGVMMVMGLGMVGLMKFFGGVIAGTCGLVKFVILTSPVIESYFWHEL